MSSICQVQKNQSPCGWNVVLEALRLPSLWNPSRPAFLPHWTLVMATGWFYWVWHRRSGLLLISYRNSRLSPLTVYSHRTVTSVGCLHPSWAGCLLQWQKHSHWGLGAFFKVDQPHCLMLSRSPIFTEEERKSKVFLQVLPGKYELLRSYLNAY